MKKRGMPDACYLSELNVPGKPNRPIAVCCPIEDDIKTGS